MITNTETLRNVYEQIREAEALLRHDPNGIFIPRKHPKATPAKQKRAARKRKNILKQR